MLDIELYPSKIKPYLPTEKSKLRVTGRRKASSLIQEAGLPKWGNHLEVSRTPIVNLTVGFVI